MPDHLSASDITTFVVVGMCFMVFLALAMVFFASRAQKRFFEQRLKTHALELEYQRNLAQQNLLTQEQERRRIAAHLHDDVGSKLGVLHLSFFRLQQVKSDQQAYSQMAAEIDNLIGDILERTRSISHELMPPAIEDFGLAEALQEHCTQIRKTGAVNIHFQCNLDRTDIPDPDAELNLFRIVQELSNNTLKYANAKKIDIQLSKNVTARQLRYHDDGRGFDLSVLSGKGLGLKNLENRVKLLNGTLKINTGLRKGVEVLIDF
jgi:signal transduction histidine kinase